VSSRNVGAFVTAWFLGLAIAERRWPLRPRRAPGARRTFQNLGMAALAGAVSAGLERPVALRVAVRAVRERRGLVQRLRLPPAAETAAAVALLDYTLYLWHVLTHRVPLLWRFHAIHHADRDLASTCTRSPISQP
jgi:sterol desaturase/sphingolipid hydroxylase (fatty acid hydroxylase superfamily)